MTTVLDHTDLDTSSTEILDDFTEAHSAPAPVVAAAPTPVLDASGFNEAGLRELEGHDYLVAAAWGIAGGIGTSAAAVMFLPAHMLALTLVLGAGLGFLGYLDHATQLIRNKHNLFFGICAALLLGSMQVVSGGDVLLPAVLSAAGAFVFMLALTVITGIAGGGDIKLSPIPAALLGAISPIAAMLWLLFTFVLCLCVMIAAKIAGSKQRHMAMAPLMAVAAAGAIVVYGLLANALGI